MTRQIIWLSILITSYFYCLPLGRFNFAGFDSDFRVFDFAIILFWLVNWNYLVGRIRFIHANKKLSTHPLKILIIVILVSIIFNIMFRGLGYLGPTAIRAFRFVSYLLTLVALVAIVDSRKKFKIILAVFFLNLFVQATLAFLQALNILGHFWPLYWREMYAFNDAPVATLSPHHKHMGVVMLMGLCVSLGLLQYFKNITYKLFFGISGVIMLLIPLFSGTRTFLLGVAGVLLAILWTSKGRAWPVMVFLGLAFVMIYLYLPDEVKDVALAKINEKYEDRIVREYEVGGIAELASERTIIYESIFRALQQYPFLIITGTGFQAGTVFVFGNGAHNNFLQYQLETGVVGLYFFIAFLFFTSRNLNRARQEMPYRLERTMAEFCWIGLMGLICTMFVGETMYAQASMFTLSGQIMVFLGLGIAPFFWQSIKINGVPFYN